MTAPLEAAVVPPAPDDLPPRRKYRDVILLLLAAAVVGAIVAFYGGRLFWNKVLLDAGVALGIAAGILVGVLAADARRRGSEAAPEPASAVDAGDVVSTSVTAESLPGAVEATPADTAPADATAAADGDGDAKAASRDDKTLIAEQLFPDIAKTAPRKNFLPSLMEIQHRLQHTMAKVDALAKIRVAIGVLGLIAAVVVLGRQSFRAVPELRAAIIAAALCVAAAALCAGVARYLGEVPSADLPESPGLVRGARVIAWVLVFAAASIGLQWAQQFGALRVLHFLISFAILATCGALILGKTPDEPIAFPVTPGPINALGTRPNILASLLDAGERQLGIDLRSTWALTVVRRSIEPLLISLVLAGWLTTSLTVVGLEERGLVERLGVPVADAPLEAGLHLHWPWPIDRVYRIPVQRAQSIGVGHEGEEAPGPENVLWSVQHAANEFTLLLGNGRDLITIDAAVHFRITDPRAWHYHSQNPEEALKALAYRAVMRNTVNRTLADALSENVAILTQHIRQIVQRDADSLGLGVSIIGFTVGGMHPPVAVSPAYEGVVSAQIRKATAVINAQVFRNQALPHAEAEAVVAKNGAQAEAAETLGKAAGEAWSFRTLESQYRASPAEYMFRRRLETMEKGLSGRPFTIVDARFLRDGGELWIVP